MICKLLSQIISSLVQNNRVFFLLRSWRSARNNDNPSCTITILVPTPVWRIGLPLYLNLPSTTLEAKTDKYSEANNRIMPMYSLLKERARINTKRLAYSPRYAGHNMYNVISYSIYKKKSRPHSLPAMNIINRGLGRKRKQTGSLVWIQPYLFTSCASTLDMYRLSVLSFVRFCQWVHNF